MILHAAGISEGHKVLLDETDESLLSETTEQPSAVHLCSLLKVLFTNFKVLNPLKTCRKVSLCGVKVIKLSVGSY